MRRWLPISLALTLSVLLANPVLAQREKGRWGGDVWSGGGTVGPVASNLSGDLIGSSETH
jgi:hypothetical protein